MRVPHHEWRSLSLTLVALLVLGTLCVVASTAQAQVATGSLTIRVVVNPAIDAGRFDVALNNVVPATGVGLGDSGSTGPQSVLAGSVAVSERATEGTSLPLYTTTVSCADGATIIVPEVALLATNVTVAPGANVICTFVNTLIPVVLPPIPPHPILLPPAFVRGTAILRGVEGCTARTVIATRIIGRNIYRIVFRLDGHIVKRVKAPSLSWRSYALYTVLAPRDHELHTVTVSAFFVNGATPRVKSMVHRFAHCRASAVAG